MKNCTFGPWKATSPFGSSLGCAALLVIAPLVSACTQKTHELVTAIIIGDVTTVTSLLDRNVNASALVTISDKDRHLQRLMMGLTEKQVADADAFKKSMGFSEYQFLDKIELTPLMAAASIGNRDITHLLLTRHADVAAKTSDGGVDALMIAANKGHLEIAQMLLDKGADATARTHVGRTALMMAVTTGHLPITRLLLDRGADVHARTVRNEVQDDSTALMMAAGAGQVDMVSVLLERKADVNAKTDAFGETALIKAVKRLGELKGGLDAREENPRYVTARRDLLGVTRVLRQKGADVSVTDSQKRSALTFARQARDQELLDLLERPLRDEPGPVGGFRGSAAPVEEPLRVGGEVQVPIEVSRVEPDYPEAARKARLQGIVILEAIITKEGAVESVRPLRGLGSQLDNAAIRAVSQWKYKPATVNSRPVRVYLTVTVPFKLP
jgi:TonB family protein